MAMRWHKATNKLRDGRYMLLTAASRGVMADLEEMLSAEPVITANVSVWAAWLGLDRRIVREAMEAISESGLLSITSEVKGKQGTFYTVATPDLPHTNPEPTPNHVPHKSAKNAGLQAAPLNRREENKKRIDNTPLPPKGEDEGQEVPEEVPFSEPLLDEPGDLPDDDEPTWKKDAAFVAFWKAYPGPRRKGAPKCFTLWKKHKLGTARLPDVIDKLNEDKASPEWVKDGGRFIPMPSTWLNQQRWLDDPVPPPPPESNLLPFSQATAQSSDPDDRRARYAW